MGPKLLELRPKRELLHPDFNGYKLSLASVPVARSVLPALADRALPSTAQYSLLHAKLFGLHNHLVGEQIEGLSYVYLIDKTWTVQKTYLEPFSHALTDPISVWQIPNRLERREGDYNLSMKFPSENFAVLSDGTGMLYILDTGPRGIDSEWNVIYSGEILGVDKQFVIKDVFYKNGDANVKELHLLLLTIFQEQSSERFVNILSWVTLTVAEDGKWGVVALRELRAKGELHYCYFEPKCEAVYIASEESFKFTVDSENPIVEKQERPKKKYVWSQDKESVNVKFKLPGEFVTAKLKVETTATEFSVEYDGGIVLTGKLYQAIDSVLTTWTVESTNMLEVSLSKLEVGLMWPELIEGDDAGEFVVDSCIAEEIHERLQHLTSDSEVNIL